MVNKNLKSFKKKLTDITTLVLDVDGVLTDGTFWWGSKGEEYKRFSFIDVMGISLACKAGIKIILISGEDNQLVDRFANKMCLSDVYKGAKDKLTCVRDLMAKYKLKAEEICYIADDVNDIPALKTVGLPIAVKNANANILSCVLYQTKESAGKGAVREVVDMLLASRRQR